jgi:hypothetical protein
MSFFVYYLYDERWHDILYIGSTGGSLNNRLIGHKSYACAGKTFTSLYINETNQDFIKIKEIARYPSRTAMLAAEQHYIKKYTPPFNRQSTVGIKDEWQPTAENSSK